MVAQQTALITGVPQAEILLSNGSGLGVENQISPRAVCTMFATLQRYLQANSLTLADLFPVSGRDKGTIEDRSIPKAAVVKTGTLNDVSTLAGVVPTRDRGLVWFAILNRGNDLDGLRAQQDSLLQALVRQWGAVASPPVAITPTAPVHSVLGLVGDDRRNEIVQSAVETNWYRQ
jgi:D-alanyl-D-alanine carboxypeptidase/D-alanyl-D-alanine-endopeptidase (penicillin-binding protein 4)